MKAGDAYMSSLMCSYFMLILLLNKMFVFCVFFYSRIILIQDPFLLHANSNLRSTGVSKNKFQRGANFSTHAIARFLIVSLVLRFTVLLLLSANMCLSARKTS